jgi:hypothetical protein
MRDLLAMTSMIHRLGILVNGLPAAAERYVD